MKHAVLMLVCAFTLCSCGMFGKSEPRHMTTPAEWEKYGYRDHVQDSSQITNPSKTDDADPLQMHKDDPSKDTKKAKKKKKSSS
ncbi:hypothetical protein [Acetobacter orleanensis]|uniref:Lipoprotein n=1 Tax=Acetobacter orleanensis TaxID=104099 RepID=A0A4Y3TK56_9PROT|nr:hypothetical protein [Acetobacter orleanensis]KXV62913.1 hypothetical protein AD949_09235 [Acetobacter orleanensis]PCD80694.1 hypothetical protein CO710_02970 [Acetobacter orleanensis]GAN67954.1 hypothetical protein Abol_014_005 [Acetobacter orleanensis JCM 7639]GBR27538.1 hypothetical protein AA0473_1467 [Acetobacter orleanensis NRIC 0473]GEB82124.1 hypothetical protein AOR01nite_06010 [Acetobacter orleanensis]